MKELICKTENTHEYKIVIENGLRDRLAEHEEFFSQYTKVVIVSDKNVAKLYLNPIKRQLKQMGREVSTIIIEPGEVSKSFAVAEDVLAQLTELDITRTDLVLALGGGVVGDLAGFCAATYMRGIDYVQMPTTLLAQVDSSVGGKTGINLPQGKNLVGVFHQPEMVLIDPQVLDSLDDETFATGMAEVIKYGCISSAKLFLRLLGYQYQEDLMAEMDEIIAKCVFIKKNIVETDEKEGGLRRILNFGHTIGHVIETYFGYGEYTHGDAIAIGMYQITKMSIAEGITKPETLDNLKLIFDTYGLPYEMPRMDMEQVKRILANDKKFEGNTLNLCVIPKIGKSEIVRVQKELALALFE